MVIELSNAKYDDERNGAAIAAWVITSTIGIEVSHPRISCLIIIIIIIIYAIDDVTIESSVFVTVKKFKRNAEKLNSGWIKKKWRRGKNSG